MDTGFFLICRFAVVKNESRIKIILRTADVDFNAQRICD
jgi:hypothetical protein